MGFRLSEFEFGSEGLGFRVQDFGFGVQGLQWGLVFKVCGLVFIELVV